MLFNVVSDYDVGPVEDHYSVVVKFEERDVDNEVEEDEVIELLREWCETAKVIFPIMRRQAMNLRAGQEPMRLKLEVDGKSKKRDVLVVQKAVERLCQRAIDELNKKLIAKEEAKARTKPRANVS